MKRSLRQAYGAGRAMGGLREEVREGASAQGQAEGMDLTGKTERANGGEELET